MIKQNRSACPDCLSHVQHSNNEERLTNSVRWGRDWEIRKRRNPTASFNWHIYQGNEVNHLLLDPLRLMTNYHCSFCDKAMLDGDSDTIEHFKPKAIFHLEAFLWSNLFLSCGGCQKAVKDWDEGNRDLLLKPDEAYYGFSTFFYFDTGTGRIEINKRTTTIEEQERARVTIGYFRLNDFDRPKCREKFFLDFSDENEPTLIKNGFDLDFLPYRFMFSK